MWYSDTCINEIRAQTTEQDYKRNVFNNCDMLLKTQLKNPGSNCCDFASLNLLQSDDFFHQI
jgi:hypothetical protein